MSTTVPLNQSSSKLYQGNVYQTAMLSSLIADLANKDGFVRQRAREALVVRGKPAVAPLLKALATAPEQVRWEAAKALSEISPPEAAPALVEALRDDSFGVRWLVAEALISLGRAGLKSLLVTLMNHPDSVRLREGAHHVLRTTDKAELRPILAPVIEALESIEPAVELPRAAHAALARLN